MVALRVAALREIRTASTASSALKDLPECSIPQLHQGKSRRRALSTTGRIWMFEKKKSRRGERQGRGRKQESKKERKKERKSGLARLSVRKNSVTRVGKQAPRLKPFPSLLLLPKQKKSFLTPISLR